MDLAAIARIAELAHAGQVDKQGRDYFDAHLAPIARGAGVFDGAAALYDAATLDGADTLDSTAALDDTDALDGTKALDDADPHRITAAAWLHDILEDTATTAADLAAQGVDPEVIAAVESVTRRPGEAYADLISRACAHPVGRYVKLVDNAWNLTSNPELAKHDPARAKQLRDERYLPARARLLAATGLTGRSGELWELQELLAREAARLRGEKHG